jgi:hypothetical protein
MIPVPRPVQPVLDARLQDCTDWEFLLAIIGRVYKSDGSGVALEMVEAAIEASPEDGNLRMILGKVLLASDCHEAALAALTDAMRIGTDVEILDLMAEAIFPGPRYVEHLLGLHKWRQPETYLEIGLFKGDTLALAQPGTCATGVDPRPRPEAYRRYLTPTCIHPLTSDEYFGRLAGHETKLSVRVDLAFIDGLHLYEQVLRDFINVERYCYPASIIVLHDTLPAAAAATTRQRQTKYWCGDVWKIRPCLQKYRPDLTLLTIPTHPSGLTLVVGLDRNSHVLADRFDEAVAEFELLELPLLPIGCPGDIGNGNSPGRRPLTAA